MTREVYIRGVKLINTVREHRRRSDMTQAELADLVDVSRQTIASIEAGGYVPSALLAARLSFVLDVRFEELFKLEDCE